MPPIPFSARSTLLQARIRAAVQTLQPGQSAEAFYAAAHLGLLNEEALNGYLDQISAAPSSSAAPVPQPAAPAAPPSATPVAPPQAFSEADQFQVRSLRWLQINAHSPEDKAFAKRRYQEILFRLWRKHVAATGQCYYPRLSQDLLDYFEIHSDPDRN